MPTKLAEIAAKVDARHVSKLIAIVKIDYSGFDKVSTFIAVKKI